MSFYYRYLSILVLSNTKISSESGLIVKIPLTEVSSVKLTVLDSIWNYKFLAVNYNIYFYA